MSPHAAEFNRTMDDLNRFVKIYNLPSDVRRRLREYFHATRHLRLAATHNKLLADMSPSLQSECMWLVHKPWLMRVHFLQQAPHWFMAELAVTLEAQVFAPGELAPRGFLYVVHSGVVLFGGRVLTAGKVWGLDVIISNVKLRSVACGRAMTYLEVYRISGRRLMELASTFPSMHKHMRWHAVKLAMHRYMVRVVAESKLEEASKKAGGDRPELLREASRNLLSTGSNFLDMLKRTSVSMDANTSDEEMLAKERAALSTIGGMKDDFAGRPSTIGAGDERRSMAGNETSSSVLEKLSQHGTTLASVQEQQKRLAADVAELKAMMQTVVQALQPKGE